MKSTIKTFVIRHILMFFLFVLLFTGRATSQSEFHELSVSYGVRSSTEIIRNGWIDEFLPIMTIGLVKIETTNTKVTGPVIFSWKYIPKSRWSIGIVAGRVKGSYDETIGSYWAEGESVNHCKYSAFTIAPETDFRYIQKENITLYSSAAVGLTFLAEEINGSEEKRNHIDGHLSIVGLRYGEKLGAFAELGFGFKGLINFGINLRL
ncbi:hypothetical protein [Mariniphaga sp.]|uniref:hypothetical protein n=1 Tax=Mariniphaga sp. TaxID=1954475 RepID=UPI00356B1771